MNEALVAIRLGKVHSVDVQLVEERGGRLDRGRDEDLLKGAHLAFMARLDIPLDVDLERWPPESI